MSASSLSSPRIGSLDALRGIAIAGMVLMHVAKVAEGSGPAFEWWKAGIDFFVKGKFYTVFALLFGIGCALELAKLEREGDTPVVFLRRLACLAIILGALKALFAASLLYYAMWGAPLVLLHRLSSPRLCAVAVVLLATQPLLAGVISPPHNMLTDFLRWADPGTRGPFVLAVFIAGLLAVRHDLVRDPASHRVRLAGIALTGVLVAVSALMLAQWWPGTKSFGFGLIRTEWLGISYAAVVVLLLPQGVRALSIVGRASLSNYALHLIVLHFLFDPWGLALSLDWRLSVPVAAVVFSTLAGLSAWWLRSYRQGPLEWLWRSMAEGTLASRQPLLSRH